MHTYRNKLTQGQTETETERGTQKHTNIYIDICT